MVIIKKIENVTFHFQLSDHTFLNPVLKGGIVMILWFYV